MKCICVLQLVLCWGFCEHKVVLWCGSTSGLKSWSGQSTETQKKCVQHKDVWAVGCFTWTKTSNLTVRDSLVHTFYHKKTKQRKQLSVCFHRLQIIPGECFQNLRRKSSFYDHCISNVQNLTDSWSFPAHPMYCTSYTESHTCIVLRKSLERRYFFIFC